MLLLTFCRTCFTEPKIWKTLRISHSEPRNVKLNLWVKPKKYLILWKAAMKVEYVINFKSPDTRIKLLSSQPFDLILSIHCRSGPYIFQKSSNTIFFFHRSCFPKHLKSLVGNLFIFGRVLWCCSTQSSNQQNHAGEYLKNIPIYFSESNMTWISDTFEHLPSTRLRSWLAQ